MKQLQPIHNSPWFWMVVYCGWTFVAFALLTFGKYGKRQSQLERQYQGRMLAADKDSLPAPPPSADGNATVELVDGELKFEIAPDLTAAEDGRFSSSESTVIALWPLTIVFFVLAAFGGVMLWRERRQMSAADTPPPSALG